MTYCDPADFDAWSQCAGKPSLEEQEEDTRVSGALPKSFVEAVKARAIELKTLAKTVTFRFSPKIDISLITSEKGALDTPDALLIAEFNDHSVLELYDFSGNSAKLRIDALAAFLAYGLLHQFRHIRLISGPKLEITETTVDELYVFGQKVTEAAALSLAIRGDAGALAHLRPGRYCLTCRASYRCPDYSQMV